MVTPSAPTPSPATPLDAQWPECEEFYNLMQTYRHSPFLEPYKVKAAYEEVKVWLRAHASQVESAAYQRAAQHEPMANVSAQNENTVRVWMTCSCGWSGRERPSEMFSEHIRALASPSGSALELALLEARNKALDEAQQEVDVLKAWSQTARGIFVSTKLNVCTDYLRTRIAALKGGT